VDGWMEGEKVGERRDSCWKTSCWEAIPSSTPHAHTHTHTHTHKHAAGGWSAHACSTFSAPKRERFALSSILHLRPSFILLTSRRDASYADPNPHPAPKVVMAARAPGPPEGVGDERERTGVRAWNGIKGGGRGWEIESTRFALFARARAACVPSHTGRSGPAGQATPWLVPKQRRNNRPAMPLHTCPPSCNKNKLTQEHQRRGPSRQTSVHRPPQGGVQQPVPSLVDAELGNGRRRGGVHGCSLFCGRSSEAESQRKRRARARELFHLTPLRTIGLSPCASHVVRPRSLYAHWLAGRPPTHC